MIPLLSLRRWRRFGQNLESWFIMIALAVLSSSSVHLAAVDADAFAQNQQLRRGVNILGYDPLWRSFDQARFQARHFQTIKAGGFNAVRVNLHAFRHMGPAPDYVLGETWYRTLDWVVTNAMANDLMLILDFHEFSVMGQDPAANHAKFLSFWRQLAPRFQGASSRVVFEILNEPSKNLTPELWNQYLAEALEIIRKSNPSRTVIIGPAFWNSIDHLPELRLPEADRNLIVTVHYYLPMSFTHQGASWAEQRDKVGVEWHGTPDEIGAIRRDFQKAQNWATQEKRPIFLGEFGAYDKGDMASRARYTAAVARTAEGLGWSWAYWQWDSDFIVYDIPKDRWVDAIHDALVPRSTSSALGEFEDHGEVGNTKIAGAAVYEAGAGQYRLTGSGENIWGKTDAFHFVRRRGSGDIGLTAEVEWVGAGKNAHRKACLMVRQGLEADAPYADVAVHGDGLISLQYRRVAGGPTLEVSSPIKGPATVRLERQGDVFSLEVARPGGAFQPVGAVSVPMSDPVWTGLAVCSHDATVAETAIFSRVTCTNKVLAPGQKRVRETSLEIFSLVTGERRVVYRARDHFEAPNWFPDGQRFLLNRGGSLYTLPVGGGELTKLDTGLADRCNNDHGLSADGKWLVLSHHKNGVSMIYVMPSAGGPLRQITPLGPSYWHGWSPDGKTLVYCAERDRVFDVYTMPLDGGEERRLTSTPGLDDGPEYTADGQFIYWNSERSGLMKIWRMKADGSQPEQVTTDTDYADWFAHPSPDGKWLVFLSFDKSVKGHPENQDVVLRLMPLAGGKPRVLTALFGGQGTINVPSWSPDSQSFAFVSYRLLAP